jgi:hypothetical protein
LKDEQYDAIIKAVRGAVQVWGLRFSDIYYWEPSGGSNRWHASTGRFVISYRGHREAAFISI